MNNVRTRNPLGLLSLLALVGFASPVNAQWSFTVLHPSGATISRAYAGSAGQQVGYVDVNGASHAGYWSGNAGSFVDLDPSGTYFSYANAAYGNQQAGQVIATAFAGHAYLWSGTSGSAVDLHPAGYMSSSVLAMSGSSQGGYVNSSVGPATERAAMWSGTAGSFVDLHPTAPALDWLTASKITAMAGTQLAGYGEINGSRRALLWNGSAENVVNLHSGVATNLTASAVYAMTTTQQGGTINLIGGTANEQAAMWSGSYSSRVNLHPAGATSSRILTMAGNFQAGQVNDQAALWQGSAASWVNLHAVVVAQLGSNYTKSTVNGAYIDGDTLYLVGSAQDTVNPGTIAVMWSGPTAMSAPTITTQPLSQYADVGGSVTFSAMASGYPAPTYQWQKDGANIPGATSSSYTIAQVQATHAGVYRAIVTNMAGSAISNDAALWTIGPGPTIISQSSSRQVLAPGDSFNLGITVSGVGSISYQWVHNGVPILGATQANYSSSSATVDDNGWYLVLATDSNGTRRSSPMFLNVAPEATEVVGWGPNPNGQLNIPAGLNRLLAVSMGSYHGLGLKSDGTVVMWGGNGSLQNVGSLPVGLSNVVAIAAGGAHSLALKADGTIVAWGYNGQGQCTIPSGLIDVVAIAAGSFNSVALKSDGTVVTWGTNVPGIGATPEGLTNVIAISTMGNPVYALKSDGSVVGWGSGVVSPPAGLDNIVAISAGTGHVIAIKVDGSVTGWGGSGSYVPPDLNLTQAKAIAAGVYFSTALKPDGTVVAWGTQVYGQTAVPAGLQNVWAISSTGSTLALRDAAVPSITSQPTSITQEETLPVTFSVTATGLELTYQWRKHGIPLSGANAPTYSLPTVQIGDAGDYDVVVTNPYGQETSTIASLAVIAGPVVRSLSSPYQFLTTGNSLTLEATATGTGALSFLWYHNGQPIPGATGPTLTLTNTTLASGGMYWIAITDDHGTKLSRYINVAMAPLTTAVRLWGNDAPYIGTPNDMDDIVGIDAGLDFALAWKRDHSIVAWGNSTSGQTAVPEGLTSVVSASAGRRFAIALKSDGTVVGWGSSNYGATFPPAGLTDVIAVTAGDSHSIALKADGHVVHWGQTINSQSNIPADLGRVFAVSAGGFHTLAVKDNGMVVAWGSNSRNQCVVPAGLDNVVAVAAGDEHSLALKKDGAVIAWGSNSYGQSTVPSGLTDVVAIAAGYRHSLALKSDGTVVKWGLGPTTPADLRNAFAVAGGDDFSMAGIDASALGFQSQPGNQVVSIFDTSVFSVQVTGHVPITFQWQRLASGSSSWGNLISDEIYSGVTTSSLAIAETSIAMSGDQFRVMITDDSGTQTSSAATLTVTIPLPSITSHPTAQLIAAGTPLNLSVVASSPVSLTYQWKKNGTNIPGATSSTYTIPSVQSANEGNYTVVVTNSAGSVTSNVATLTIAMPPTITTQPVGYGMYSGQSATFSVTATSNTPLSYQWEFGGESIPDATAASYTIPDVQIVHAGLYHVVVSTIAGSVTSSPAQLTVTPTSIPLFSTSPHDVVAFYPAPVSFTAIALGTPVPDYQWQRKSTGGNWQNISNSATYSGATTTTLTVNPTTAQMSGDKFRCVATNSAGSATTYEVNLIATVPGFTKLSTGRYHSLRISTDGWLYTSGLNTSGQLGNGSSTATTTAQQVTIAGQTIADIAAGAEHSLFLTTNNEVWATGLNSTGQLADGTLVAKSTPILMATDAIAISAGNFHSVVLKSDGTLWTVGGNDSGQLGAGNTTNSTALNLIDTHVVDIAAGIRQTLFLKSDGTLWGMGNLDGSEAFVSTPYQIATNVKTMAAGGYHSLFVKTDGTLWTMGYNPQGQLGTGNTTTSATPVQITTGVQTVEAGYFHSVFIKTDGTLWAMGNNGGGQLGVGTNTNRSTPFQVTTNVATVAADENYTLFTKTDGTLWATGYNANGQFGNGGTVTTTSPVQIASGVVLAPQAPTGLAAGSASPYDRVHLTWTPDGNATSYEVWRSATNDSTTATRIATNLRWAIFEDLTTSLNQTYYYWTKSVNPSATSGFSAVASASTSSVMAQTITFTGPADQSFNATPITLSATASSGLTVTFSVISGPATLNSNELTLTGTGTVVVRASQAGNGSYSAAPDVERSFTVGVASATVTLGDLSATYDGNPHAVSATTNPAGLTVSFTYDGGVTAPTNAGSYPVVGTIDDETYAGSANGTLIIAKAAQTITFGALSDVSYSTTPITLSATTDSGLTVNFAVQSGPANLNGNDLSLTGPGTVTVRASQSGNTNYLAAASVDRSFTVGGNLQSWLTGYFDESELSNATISGLSADPDGDGFSNLLEYALGLDPISTDTTGLPEVAITTTDWVYTYTRPADRDDITYEVQVSTDLSSWTITLTPTFVSTSDDVETWQATYPLSSATNAFFRLKITD